MPEYPASLYGISHLEKHLSPLRDKTARAGLMDGGGAKSRLRCIRGKRTRERHEPELSHRKEASGHAVSPVLGTEHIAAYPHRCPGVVRSLAVTVASEALEGSRVSIRGALDLLLSPPGSLQVSSK